MNAYRNREGYPDPTAGAAIANIIRAERAEKRKAGKSPSRYRDGRPRGEKAHGPVSKPR